MVSRLDVVSTPLPLKEVNIAIGCAATEIKQGRSAGRGIANYMPIQKIIGKVSLPRRAYDCIIVGPRGSVENAKHAADNSSALLN